MHNTIDQILLPHVGWMRYEMGDAVAKFLRQGWFESDEQAFLWLYLRDGDVVVDCGAHAGLFSVLAGKLVGAGGRVVSIEPSPTTARLLRENVDEHGLSGIARVIEGAAGAAKGTISLVDEGTGKSAYNRVDAGAGNGGGVSVPVDTLESIFAAAGAERAAFLKVDVEGAELDVWAGARGLIERGALPVVMVEFTEQNLRRAGRSTEELYRTIEGSGYRLYRFDAGSGQLVARPLDGPIWYENLFAVRDVGAVNARLREADAGRRRVAWDVIQRGVAGSVAREADEHAEQAAEAIAERDAIRKEFAKSREEVRTLAQQLSQAEARVAEAWQIINRLQGDLDAARAELRAAYAKIEELSVDLRRSQAELAKASERLRSFCESKYERFSWALRIRSKPRWVDELVAGNNGSRPDGGGATPSRP